MEKQKFNRIVLMGRQRSDGIEETLLTLYAHLKNQGYAVSFEQETAESINPHGFLSCPANRLNEVADLLIVVGGDGSLLHAAKIAMEQSLPVLGINRGRLGFLTDFYPHELTEISAALQGNYQQEARFLLHAHLTAASSFTALNEIVISPGNIGHMIEFEVAVNGELVCSQRADGLILATPTGSTAYALSAGGPIIHPSLNALLLVPMFPHTLSNRPLVIDANSEVAIKITPNNIVIPFVSGDGQQKFQIPLGETIVVKKHDKKLCLIHPQNYNYFETLQAKLGWQSENPSYKPLC